MLASQYIFNLCCNIELLMIFIAIGTIIGVQGLNNTVLTLMVPPEAYPGGTIDLYCESSTTGLLYRWVDVDSTEIISEDQQYSLTIAESTEVISRTVECQAYISSMVVAKESATFTIAFVSSVTFDIREQDSINPREVVIQCFASATVSRAPKISWFYTSLTEIIQISVSTTGYQQIGNVLTILSTDPASSGVYECSATLDDVASTTKNMSTTVQIYSPPVVSLQQPSDRDVFSPIQYSSFEITCDVTGLDTPMIEWLVNGLPPDPTAVTSNMLVITEPDANSLDVITDVSYIQYSLTISSVQLDLTSVSCLASNHLGSAQVDAQIRVERLGRPCAPLNFILIGHNSYWVELKWNINTNCEEKYFASSYILEYTSRGVALKIEYFLTQGDVRNIEYTYILYHLSPYTAYQIRVSARNEYGTSEYTEYITVVTSPIDKKVIFYYGIENGDSEMEHGYYTQSIALRATTSIPVGNRRIESVYVSPFGAFSLDRRSYSWYPQRFVPYGYIQHLYLLAPFWSDIDYSEEGSISYRVYQSGNDAVHDSVIEEATQLSISHANADTNFKALAVIVATWSEVVPRGHQRVYAGINTFQAAIVTDYKDSYVLYGYNCGDMSWSSSATYPTSPVIGFTARGILYDNHYLSYNKNSHSISCVLQKDGLAVIGYKISLSTAESDEMCIKWLADDINIQSNLPSLAIRADPCPCNLFQARRDSRFRFDYVTYITSTYQEDVICYVSRFDTEGLYQRCCYDVNSDSAFAIFLSSSQLTPLTTSGNQRGSILSSNPVFYPSESHQQYTERDEEGYVQCCLLSNKCEVFYSRRPSRDCTDYEFLPFTWGFGDPHVISMDGFVYTFNGIGEYWYLFPVEQCDFQVQTRTQPIRDTEATVFTSIAVRINNCSTVFVSLLGRDDLSLFVDQQNRTDDIHSSKEIMDDCVNIEYTEPNSTQKSEISVAYRNGAFINLRADNDLIAISVSLPDSCRDRTSGLIGQWDGDMSNDLLMRNGTLLSQNVTDREKEEFADSWRITQDESFMMYETGNYSTYNPDYTPSIYLDEFLQNANITTEIQALCNGNQICLFDAVVTNDTSVAMGTIFISEESEETVRVGNNIPPLIQTPLLLFLSLDNLTTFEFNVTDEDEFSVNYALSPQSVFTDILLHNLTQSVFELQLRLIHIPDSMNMTIIANDSIGVSLVSVYVVVCHCENGGYCSDNPSGTDSVGDSGYIRSSCQCPLGYEGVYCSDIILDPCLQSVCEVETCPAGTEKNDNSLRCEDIDECALLCNQTHQICVNTYSSYLCTCEAGYEIIDDVCVDVDECSMTISPCQHTCTNTIGSYNCSCDMYYSLEPDMTTCRGVNVIDCGTTPPDNCGVDSCILVETELVCAYCERGTELSSSGRYCIDLDECALQPDICPVSSECINEYASYYCVCNQGYVQDNKSICVDVDECIDVIPVCEPSQICFNTEGSFICAGYCYLPNYYILPNGICGVGVGNVTRVPDETEQLTITFTLSIDELEERLDTTGLSLSTLFSTLNDSLFTPLQDIQFSYSQTTDGRLKLILISDSFQVDPFLVTETLKTSLISDWAPYAAYVTQVSAAIIPVVTPTDSLSLSTFLVIALCCGGFIVLLLLGLSCVWAFSASRITWRKKEKDDSIHEELLSELKKLKDTRAIVSRPEKDTAASNFPNWPKGIIKSNRLSCYPLSYLLAEDPPIRIYEEFDSVPMHLATVEDIPPACELKNRFTNILPPPHSRVPLFLKYGLPNSDYINANFIRGYNMVPRVYIATQAPMFSTEQDFWRMVWEQNTKVIIMLTEMVERSREKCVPYWPDKDILTSIRFGDIEIISKNKIVREDYQINEFILKHLHIDEVHEVSHYWYRKWPEYGVPDNPNSLVTLLLETRTELRTSSHPVLVHCASGTGRTGVVLAVDIGMHELEEKRSVDILRNVSLLRQDRGGLIQTREQYHFLYKTICAYARYLNKRGEEMN